MTGGHSVNMCDTQNVTLMSLAFNVMCVRRPVGPVSGN